MFPGNDGVLLCNTQKMMLGQGCENHCYFLSIFVFFILNFGNCLKGLIWHGLSPPCTFSSWWKCIVASSFPLTPTNVNACLSFLKPWPAITWALGLWDYWVGFVVVGWLWSGVLLFLWQFRRAVVEQYCRETTWRGSPLALMGSFRAARLAATKAG